MERRLIPEKRITIVKATYHYASAGKKVGKIPKEFQIKITVDPGYILSVSVIFHPTKQLSIKMEAFKRQCLVIHMIQMINPGQINFELESKHTKPDIVITARPRH